MVNSERQNKPSNGLELKEQVITFWEAPVFFVAFSIYVLLYGILLANIPFRHGKVEGSRNPLTSRQAYYDSLLNNLVYLGFERKGRAAYALMYYVFPTVNALGLTALALFGGIAIGLAGVLAAQGADLAAKGVQIGKGMVSTYNLFVPTFYETYPEITLSFVGGLAIIGLRFAYDKMKSFYVNRFHYHEKLAIDPSVKKPEARLKNTQETGLDINRKVDNDDEVNLVNKIKQDPQLKM